MNDPGLKRILVTLALFSFGFFLLYYFIFNDIKIRNKHISALEQELSSDLNRRQYVTSLERIVPGGDSNINAINNSIVPSDGDVKFIENLESIGRINGLEFGIDSLSFEDDPSFASSGITALKINARTKGSWPGTYAFLSQIESLPLKIKINNFRLTNVLVNALVPKAGNSWQSTFEIIVLKYK